MFERINKARYWWAVLYQESMIENWQDKIADEVQVPFAYCEHTKDIDTKSEYRKDHVHLILVFPNTTTYSHALNVFKLLGDKSINTCKAIVNIRNAYDYLIHDTDASRKAGKHLYEKSERICGNNFDIGAYEQLSQEEKDEMLQELFDFAIDNNIENSADFYIAMRERFDKSYFSIYRSHTGAIDRICKGNFLRNMRSENMKNWRTNAYSNFCTHGESNQHENAENRANCGTNRVQNHDVHTVAHDIFCSNCGSTEVRTNGKTAGGTQRFRCKDCGKSWSN